jgi:hypothetical protein
LNSTRTSNLLPGLELNSISCTVGAASAALAAKLIASVTTALRNLIPKLSLPLPTAFVPTLCFLFALALCHDLGL